MIQTQELQVQAQLINISPKSLMKCYSGGQGSLLCLYLEKSPTCIKYTVVVPAQEGYSCPVSERSLVQDDTSLEDTDQHFTCGNTFSR